MIRGSVLVQYGGGWCSQTGHMEYFMEEKAQIVKLHEKNGAVKFQINNDNLQT
jgi:hypothetical protein